jgi:hypothetical protein
MVRDDFIALCAGALMVASWAAFGWFIAPEPVESKLAKVGIDAPLIPQRPLWPGINIFECVIVGWKPHVPPEVDCPAGPPLPESQAPHAVPTS